MVACCGFWHHLRSCINHLGYESLMADPDVWIRASTYAYGTRYYLYVLLYVDNFLVVSEKSKGMLKKEIGH